MDPYILDRVPIFFFYWSVIYLFLMYACLKNYEDKDQTPDESDSDKWEIIGFYGGKTLYEQTYPSGKKAWRFKDGDDYVYPRKRDLAKNVTSWPDRG